MSFLRDAKPVQVNSFLANGGIIYTGDGDRSFFDNEKKRFILKKGLDTFTFQTLEELACSVAFLSSEIAMHKKNASRYEWFVLSFDEIYASFPRKRDALLYCMRVNEDMRSMKNITKVAEGLYEYSGPKKLKSYHFYVGLRESVLEAGFGSILEKWDKKITLLVQEQQAIEKIQRAQIRIQKEQQRREKYGIYERDEVH
jgi:hypothetical protein